MNMTKTMTLTIKPYVAAACVLLCLPQLLHATSVLQVDMEQLLNDAAVIFEGEVIASEAKWNANNSYVSTWVTFRVDDVLKGELPDATITQSFAGGTVDGTTLQVNGMVYPKVGETGIYFIEDPKRQQVNPIVGWSQGHFKVKKDEYGVERMLTESGNPIQGLGDSLANGKSVQDGSTSPLSGGAALGLRLGESQDTLDTAIDKKDFKNALRLRLSPVRAENEAPGQMSKPE